MKKLATFYKNHQAQTAMEYLLILAVIGVIVLASLRLLVPKVHDSSEDYYNSVTRVILGESPAPVNGGWCEVKCPTTPGQGNPTMHRTCECPSPAFGGAYCSGSDVVKCTGETVPTGCVSDGSCSALKPSCDQVTFGEDNCKRACTKHGPPCPH